MWETRSEIYQNKIVFIENVKIFCATKEKYLKSQCNR